MLVLQIVISCKTRIGAHVHLTYCTRINCVNPLSVNLTRTRSCRDHSEWRMIEVSIESRLSVSNHTMSCFAEAISINQCHSECFPKFSQCYLKIVGFIVNHKCIQHDNIHAFYHTLIWCCVGLYTSRNQGTRYNVADEQVPNLIKFIVPGEFSIRDRHALIHKVYVSQDLKEAIPRKNLRKSYSSCEGMTCAPKCPDVPFQLYQTHSNYDSKPRFQLIAGYVRPLHFMFRGRSCFLLGKVHVRKINDFELIPFPTADIMCQNCKYFFQKVIKISFVIGVRCSKMADKQSMVIIEACWDISHPYMGNKAFTMT